MLAKNSIHESVAFWISIDDVVQGSLNPILSALIGQLKYWLIKPSCLKRVHRIWPYSKIWWLNHTICSCYLASLVMVCQTYCCPETRLLHCTCTGPPPIRHIQVPHSPMSSPRNLQPAGLLSCIWSVWLTRMPCTCNVTGFGFIFDLYSVIHTHAMRSAQYHIHHKVTVHRETRL